MGTYKVEGKMSKRVSWTCSTERDNNMNLLTITPFITLVVTFVSGAQVEFYVNRACDSSSQTFRGDCNFCADPPFDWGAVQFSDISADTRVSIHNQDGCTGASQVGQGFGPACWLQGATKIRSAFVACPGSRAETINGTQVQDAVEVKE